MILASRRRTPQGVFQFTMVKSGAGAESAFISTDGLLRPGSSNFGLNFTAEGATVTVEHTVADPKRALNTRAEVQATVNWEPVGSVSNGSPLSSEVLATALKFTFPAESSVTITCL